MVLDFHKAFGLPVAWRPTLDVPGELLALREALLREELAELADGLEARDILRVADALGDLVYVIYGTAATFGIDLDAVVSEIHRANMSKLDEGGHPVLRSDGKVLKGPSYCPPDLEFLLDETRPHLVAHS